METGKSDTKAGAEVPLILTASKADHDLHVLLIMRGGEKSKNKALLTAYREGLSGLEKRLGK